MSKSIANSRKQVPNPRPKSRVKVTDTLEIKSVATPFPLWQFSSFKMFFMYILEKPHIISISHQRSKNLTKLFVVTVCFYRSRVATQQHARVLVNNLAQFSRGSLGEKPHLSKHRCTHVTQIHTQEHIQTHAQNRSR